MASRFTEIYFYVFKCFLSLIWPNTFQSAVWSSISLCFSGITWGLLELMKCSTVLTTRVMSVSTYFHIILLLEGTAFVICLRSLFHLHYSLVLSHPDLPLTHTHTYYNFGLDWCCVLLVFDWWLDGGGLIPSLWMGVCLLCGFYSSLSCTCSSQLPSDVLQKESGLQSSYSFSRQWWVVWEKGKSMT